MDWYTVTHNKDIQHEHNITKKNMAHITHTQ